MKPWSHLPNAHHIDWVLESLKNNPELWDVALDAVDDAARDAARDAVLNATQNAVWDAILNATWGAAQRASQRAALNAVWDAILALVAYDDCDQYLQMSYEQLLAWATLSEKPQAVLLLPLKWIQEHECLVTLA